MKNKIVKKLIAVVAAAAMGLQGVAVFAASVPNPPQSYQGAAGNNSATEILALGPGGHLTISGTGTTAADFEDRAGVGPVLKASPSGSAPYISYHWLYITPEMGKYMTINYKYIGDNSTAKVTYDGLYSTSTPIIGDGEWHTAVFDFSSVAFPAVYTILMSEIRLDFYADGNSSLYTVPFETANYRIYTNNPLIDSISTDLSPVINGTPTNSLTVDNCTVNSIAWTDENGGAIATFEAGKNYIAEISLTADENYLLATDNWNLPGAVSVAASADHNCFENTVVLTAIYDTSALDIASSTIIDGAENVKVINTKLDVTFNKKVNMFTLQIPGSGMVLVSSPTAQAPQFTITPKDDYTIEIAFIGQLELSTEYTITFSPSISTPGGQTLGAGKKITFTTAAEIERPKIASSTPADDAENVAKNTTVDIEFDMPMDTASLIDSNITVTPTVDFSVTPRSQGLTISFDERLEAGQKYTVALSENIMSAYNSALVSGSIIEFTVASNVTNIIPDGFLDKHENPATTWDDLAQGVNSTYVQENGEWSLRWKVGWNTAALVHFMNFIPGHKYYAQAELKADKTTDVWFDMYIDGRNIREGQKTLAPDTRTTISTEWTATGEGTYHAIVADLEGTIINVYNWQFYDMTVAEPGDATLVSSDITNGQSECPIENLSAELTFDKPLLPSTINANITAGSAIDKIELSRDLSTCKIYFKPLSVNQSYTIDFGSGLKTLHGDDVNAANITFSTYTVTNAPMNVISTTPSTQEGAAVNTEIEGAVISAILDTYPDAATVTTSNITASADIIDSIAVDAQNPKMINIALKNLQPGTQYSVTLTPAIKSLTNYDLVEKVITFTTKSEEYMTNAFQTAVGSQAPQTVKAYLQSSDFSDLQINCDMFNYIEQKTFIDNVSAALVGSSAATKAQIEAEVKQACIYAILTNSNDAADIDALVLSDTLGLGQESKTTYGTYIDQTGKTALAADIIQNRITQNATEVIAEKVTLAALAQANGWETVRDILHTNSTLFTAAPIATLLAQTEALTYPSYVYSQLQNLNASSYSAVQTALQSAYSANALQGAGSSGGGGSSGGSTGGPSGGSSFGVGYTPPQNVVEKDSRIFKDIDDYAWARLSIETLYLKGIISGRSEGEYAPADDVKREEFVKMLVAAAKIVDETAEITFNDVPKDMWAYKYIASAVKGNLVSGISDSEFGIGRSITREDAAVLLWRHAKDKVNESTEKTAFKDLDSAADYAREGIIFLQNVGIVSGDENGNYNPKATLTRAEAAVLLYQLEQLKG